MAPPPPPPPPSHAPAAGAAGFPVFQGEGAELTQRAIDDFPWMDFKRGSGSFSVEGGLTQWKPIGSGCKDGVAVSMHSRRLQDKGGLSEFLIRGSLPISRDSYFVLNADMEHRAEWDDSTTGIAELSASGPGPEAGPFVRRERVLHWRVKYPWPLGKREYVLEQGVHTLQEEGGDTVRCIQGRTLAKARGEAVRPLIPGTMRVEDYRANMVIWAGPAGSGANFALLYFEDSKVSLPGWLVSKVAASTIPAQLASSVKVAEAYPQRRTAETLRRFGVPARGSAVPSPAFAAATPRSDQAAGRRSPLVATAVAAAVATSAPWQGPEEPAEEDFFSPGASDDESDFGPVRRESSKRQDSVHSFGTPTSMTQMVQPRAVAAAARPPPPPPAGGGAPAAEASSSARRIRPAKAADPSGDATALVRSRAGEVRDLEEGLREGLKEGLVLSFEERELLLELLQETRERKSTSLCWCPCRRRFCGHRSRHKA